MVVIKARTGGMEENNDFGCEISTPLFKKIGLFAFINPAGFYLDFWNVHNMTEGLKTGFSINLDLVIQKLSAN